MQSIIWTPAEKESLIRVAKDIQGANPQMSNRQLLATAMERVFAEDRRRNADRVNDGPFDWFLEALGTERITTKVVWSAEERAALIEEATRIRSEENVIRNVELLKRAMLVLPADRKRNVNSMAGTSWDWFRKGVSDATKKILECGKEGRPDEPMGVIRKKPAEVTSRSQEKPVADRSCEDLGESKSLFRLVKELEVRLARIERDLYEEDHPAFRG